MNGQVEVTWRTLKTIANSIMVHRRVYDKYINFDLMYMTDHIFSVLPIKSLLNQYGEPTTPHKMETGTKHSVSNLHVLFFSCVSQKATAHVDTKSLNMCHQSQKGYSWYIRSKSTTSEWHLIYIPSTQKTVSSHDVVFDETFYSALAYTSRTYS